MSEITWEITCLSELGTFSRGKSKHRPRNDVKLFEGGKYPLVQTGDVKAANLYITKNDSYYNDFGLKQSKLWAAGTLCITIAANIAETAILSYPMCFPDSIVGFNANPEKSSELFVYYFFEYIKKEIQKSASGSIQDNINIDYLSKMRIKVPEKKYQDKIVELLSSIDKKMVYHPELKREIPEGWGVDSLWNIANFYNGLAMQKYRPDTNEDDYLPVIKIREMMNGFTKDTEKARLDIPTEAVVESGDILFSWSATLEVIIWGKEKGALNQHIFKVTSDTYPKYFIYFELKSYLKVFKSIAELRKTTMGHITQDHLKQAKIVVPPIEIISKLDAKLQPIMLKQQILENQNQELIQLRDWLLPMLMNGQVKVE